MLKELLKTAATDRSQSKRIAAAKKAQKLTHETEIIYWICTELKTDCEIEGARTVEEARSIIKGISDEYKKIDGHGIRLYIRPDVIDNDSGELVTDKNLKFYDLQSEWVKELIKNVEIFNEA